MTSIGGAMACFLGTLTTCKDFRKSCRAIKPVINQLQIKVPDLWSYVAKFVSPEFFLLTFDLEPYSETLIGKQVQRVSSFFFFSLIPSFSRNASLLVGVILATMSWVDRFSRKTTWLRWEQQFSKFSWQTTRYNTYTPGKFNCHGSRQQRAMVIISLLTSVYNRSSPSCPQA